ncbi:MAG: NAD(P)/FAD-dependent oxidoreductase [Bacteroidetes bacterium]|nr:NAD(P)/FAD-dependent oxidoreductase [Bacteroidota bacterium]
MDTQYDIVIVGAGIVGCAIALELSRYNITVALVDSRSDVGAVTSKANSAILHSGFDAPPHSIESLLVQKGYKRFNEYCSSLGLPIEKIGGLLIAWDQEQLQSLPTIIEKGRKNGQNNLVIKTPQEIYSVEPNLGEGVLGGILIPDESITCTFTAPIAFATTAVVNGVTWRGGTQVQHIKKENNFYRLATNNGSIQCRILINAAGLYSDEIDRMVGFDRFTVTPRRGEFIILDKEARSLLSHIILPIPTKITKGVLICPTIFGNVLLGPTADNILDKNDTSTTIEGLENLRMKAVQLMPKILNVPITTTYSGLRAATEHSDYQLFFEPQSSYICVGGIRSTGMSSSLGIAEFVVEHLSEFDLKLENKINWATVKMPNIAESIERASQSSEKIKGHSNYGKIVCHCEQVSLREVELACEGPLPARSLDGVRRRTRAMLGRCQGFYCLPNIVDICSHQMNKTPEILLGIEEKGNIR